MDQFAKASSPANENEELARAISGQWGLDDDVFIPKRKSLSYQYWRMCQRPNCRKHTDKRTGKSLAFGWITTGPTMASDPAQFYRYQQIKHMTPLDQYGDLPVGEASEITNPHTRFAQIMRLGGLYEFPADQIIAYGWDKLEVIKRYRPDVAGVERIPCRYGCVDRDFSSIEAMREHMDGAHKQFAPQEAQGQQMRDAVTELVERLAPQPGAQMDPTQLALTIAATLQALGVTGGVPGGVTGGLPGTPGGAPAEDDVPVYQNVKQARAAAAAKREQQQAAESLPTTE